MPDKLRVVFVGAFTRQARDGTVGGQVFDCQWLMQSPISNYVDWILIDSMMASQPPPNLLKRTIRALSRVLRFAWLLTVARVDSVLILSPYLMSSLLEKGTMCLLGRLFSKRVVLRILSEVRPEFHHGLTGKYRSLVLHACEQIVCQSSVAAQAIQNDLRIGDDKIRHIPSWIDMTEYLPSLNKHKNTSTQEPLHFLYLGWVESFKGVLDLIEAIRLTKGQLGDAKFTICGGGSLLPTVRQLIREYSLSNMVEAPGWVHGHEKLHFLQDSDVFVLPSYSEGLPNSMLEAMASGLAVISTPVGGIPGLIENGVNGLLVQPGDVLALSKSLLELNSFPERAREMGRRNRQLVSEKHDVGKIWPAVAKSLGVQLPEMLRGATT